MPMRRACLVGHDGRCLAGGVLLLRYDNRGTDIFNVLEHEDRVLFGVFQFLEQEKGFFIVAQTPLYPIA